jgi:hypothetical protein
LVSLWPHDWQRQIERAGLDCARSLATHVDTSGV